MARTSLKVAVITHTIALFGCAPWSGAPSAEYVTVETETGQDTAAAKKMYKSARTEMTKYCRGESCNLASVEKRLQQALAADVRFGPAHHSLGLVYFWQQKLYLAAWEFEYAARLMPDRFEPLNNLGLVYESVGKFDQAKMYYSLAREIAPDQPQVIGNLARVSLRNGQKADEIRPLLEDVLATDTRPEWRGWARERLGLSPAPTSPESATGSVQTEPVPSRLPPSDSAPTIEELPLIVPPPPDVSLPDSAFDKSTSLGEELGPSLELELSSAPQASTTN